MSMIPNPKKNVTIDFTMAEIKNCLDKFPTYFKSKYVLVQKNDLLNQYTFSALDFLSLGVYIDINLNFITETKTDIIVEIRRKIGATDEWVDVQKANNHIQIFFNNISTLLANVRKATVPVDAANPVQVFATDLPWSDIKRHLNTLVLTYPGTYRLVEQNNLTDEIILRRVPQKGDDIVLNKNAILKITKIFENENKSGIRFEITNENNKISTQGELERNTQILKITINLLHKIINELKNKIAAAETELSNIRKWKIGRKDKEKIEQIEKQSKVIEELNQKLKTAK